MLKNLKAEMTRNGIHNNDIAQVIGKSKRTVSDKTGGRYPFSIEEAIKIRDELFQGLELEYLFSNTEAG